MSRRQRQNSIGCSVGERTDGSLRLRFRWQGRAKSIATGLKATAENWKAVRHLADLVGPCLKLGRDPVPIIRQYIGIPEPSVDVAEQVTVRAYYEQWIAQQMPVVRKAQARNYRRHIEGYVLPLIGDVPLSDLKPSDVRGLQAELLTKGRPRGGPEPRRGVPSKHVPLKPKTVKNILGGSLRAMLNAARGDELLPRDVFADHPWPKVVTPEPDPFAPDERTRILQWFAEKTFRLPAPGTMRLIAWPHPAYHAFLHLLFWTGMRPSEAAGLQWGDIELTKDRLHVRRSRYLWEYGEPKTTSARRTVRLFPETVRGSVGVVVEK